MKSYLLIDLDKVEKEFLFSEQQFSRIFVFAKKKKNRERASDWVKCHSHATLVKIAKDEKLAAVLMAKLEKLLEKQPDAKIVIESPRQKIAKRVNELLNHHAEAQIVLVDWATADNENDEALPETTATEQPEIQEIEKKEENQQPEPKSSQAPSENKLMGKPDLQVPNHIEKQDFKPFAKAQTKLPEIKGAKKVKQNAMNIELSHDNAQPTDLLDKLTQNYSAAEAERKLAKMLSQPEFDAVTKRLDTLMNVLKKTHVKKKDILIRELAQNLNLNHNEATSLLVRLQSFGIVNMDTDTVKFNNLMNLLKLR